MSDLKQYALLTRLQIRMALSFLRHGKDGGKGKEKRSISKTTGLLIAFAILGGFSVFLEIKVVDVAVRLSMPGMLMQLVAFAATMLSLMYCLVQGVMALYFRKDIENYAPLPVKSRMLYLAQLTMIYLPECGMTALILLPMAGVYMARVGFDFGLLAAAAALIFAIPLIPVALGALVGGGIASLPAFRRHREGFATTMSAVVMLVSVVLNYSLGRVTGTVSEDSEAMMRMLSGREEQIGRVAGAFPPARWAAEALMGEWAKLLLLFAAGLALIALAALLFGNRYLALAATDQEAPVRKRRQEGYRLLKPGISLLRREWREIVRTPVYLLNCGMAAFVLPLLMTGGMVMGFSQAGPDLNELLRSIVGETDLTVLAAVFAAMFSFMSGMNTACATAVSREGKCHGVMAGLPVDPFVILRSKVLSGFLFAVMGLIIPTAVLIILLPALWLETVKAFIWSVMLNFIFSCVAVTVDALKPKLDWRTQTEAVKQNYNQVFSMLVGFAVLGALGFMTWAILKNGLEGLTWYMTGTLVILCAAGCLLLKKLGVRAYTRCED